ncbi:MAG: CBS domain-containing protein [Porticoccus sp.]
MNKTIIKARDVMHEKHIEMDGLDTVKHALETMKVNHASVLIVKKRNENDALGMVVLADIAKKVLAKDKAPDRVNLYEIMSKPVISVEPDLDVRYCARLFDRFGLSNAPVVEQGKVIGIVSYDELVFKGLCELID